jgi:peroxiredoxin
MYKRFRLSTLSVIVVLLFSACNFSQSSEKKEVVTEMKAGSANSDLKKAPQFEVVTIDGQTISLKQSLVDQKPMIVYFTASWCPMCAKNWPAISEVYPEYKDRVNFVAISIDPTDDNEVMTKLAEDKNIDFPLVKGTPKVMIDFGVQTQATTVGINKAGYVEFQKDKKVLTADEYRALFEQLLK